MADKTDIGWTDATWQIITGCSIDTPGCTNCYAMDLAGTRLKNHPSRVGLTKEVNGKHVWTGEVRFNRGWLLQPLQWKRPREIFVAAHGDLFHANVLDEWLDQIFAVMALCPQHTFQVLTKRAERMRKWSLDIGAGDVDVSTRIEHAMCEIDGERRNRSFQWPLPNVWLGVSTERQKEANERIPLLLQTPAAKHFVSAEPLLKPIDFERITIPSSGVPLNALTGKIGNGTIGFNAKIDQIITGGESGRGKRRPRPVHVEAFRSIRDQCARSGTAFFHKQNGSWLHETQGATSQWQHTEQHIWPDGSTSYLVGTTAAGALLDGVLHEGRP